MVKGFPFEVPAKYDNLPQLKARTFACCMHACERHVRAPQGIRRAPAQPAVSARSRAADTRTARSQHSQSNALSSAREQGRATIEMKLSLKTPRLDGVQSGVFTIVADGARVCACGRVHVCVCVRPRAFMRACVRVRACALPG